MGVVYLLKNVNPSHFMAPEYLCLKTFKTGLFSSERQFSKEAELWMLLGRYEHILHAYDYGNIQDNPFILMQFAESGNLKNIHETQFYPNPIENINDYARASALIIGLTLGLIKIYNSLNLPHGDLSTNNILLSQNGNLLKISDFGVASIIHGFKNKSYNYDVNQYGKIIWFILSGRENDASAFYH